MTSGHYGRLLLMAALSFAAMFVLMYAMVDVLGNVYVNVNQVYMAGLMAAPMVVIELLLMSSMYKDKRLNAIFLAGSLALFVVFYLLLRQQAAVSDTQFLRSMIPHHGGAILMCERAPVQDPEILDLCDRILANQQAEIAEMKAKLVELES
ncbi:MAG TPA: DUF305 domain-containing protein [Anaerolineales bacterium]|nr:DUF305 domain-containing protein [Anaerolineales bacterium]